MLGRADILSATSFVRPKKALRNSLQLRVCAPRRTGKQTLRRDLAGHSSNRILLYSQTLRNVIVNLRSGTITATRQRDKGQQGEKKQADARLTPQLRLVLSVFT